jgi:hydrogenase nickel incorporation protein HypB
MIEHGLVHLRPRVRSLVFIENVGNLVCPALFDLGERAKVVVMSITEGDDKPLKYPHVFRAATVMVLTKVDLAPHVDVDPVRCAEHARRINPALRVFPIAAAKGQGMAEWIGWLRGQMEVAHDGG